jgi:hypothetical protein
MELVNELKTYLATVENRVEAVKRKFDTPAAFTEDAPEPKSIKPPTGESADLFS